MGILIDPGMANSETTIGLQTAGCRLQIVWEGGGLAQLAQVVMNNELFSKCYVF